MSGDTALCRFVALAAASDLQMASAKSPCDGYYALDLYALDRVARHVFRIEVGGRWLARPRDSSLCHACLRTSPTSVA